MKKSVILVVCATILASVAQVLYKLGADALPGISLSLLVGFALYCIAGLLIVFALRTVDMSVVFPMLALTFVLVALLSVLVLGESLLVINGLGIVLIVGGVGLLGGAR